MALFIYDIRNYTSMRGYAMLVMRVPCGPAPYQTTRRTSGLGYCGITPIARVHVSACPIVIGQV